MSNPSPLDYAQVQPRRPIRWGIHIAIAIQAAAYLAVPMAVLLVLVPRFEATFRDYGADLPTVTKRVLSLSRWARSEYGWMFLLPLAAFPALVGLWLDRRGVGDTGLRVYRYLMRIALLVLAIVFSILLLLACYAPMMGMILQVSGGARK